jgi:hypothetical protein
MSLVVKHSTRVFLNPRTSWFASAWVARNIAAYLVFLFEDGSLAKEEERLQHLHHGDEAVDLSDLKSNEMQALYKAARLGLRLARAKGAAAWFEPESYPEFIEGFERLVTLLCSDERIDTT